MSAAPIAVESGEAKSSRRRRTPGSRRPKGDGAAAAKGEPVERKPRPESLPVPAAMIGQKVTGRVTTIVKKSRLKFGFIHIGAADADEETLPRIYFSFTDVTDADVTIRNKDLVQFECKKDEKDRAFASAISLTAEGKVAHDAKEAEFAAAKAIRDAKGPSEQAPKKERAPRERKPQEVRNVTLRVTCEGKDGEQKLEINCAASVGKAKNVATVAFDAPLTHNVFHLTAAEPVFLTKAILAGLQTDDRIHLGAPVEGQEAPAAKA